MLHLNYRHCLWIVGNGDTLRNIRSIWAKLIHDAQERMCFFSADEDKDIADVVLTSREELQFYDEYSSFVKTKFNVGVFFFKIIIICLPLLFSNICIYHKYGTFALFSFLCFIGSIVVQISYYYFNHLMLPYKFSSDLF